MPVRKAGKLPWAVVREEYELEYGRDKLEIHRDAIHPDERVLVIDDVLATGGTALATARLVEALGGDDRRHRAAHRDRRARGPGGVRRPAPRGPGDATRGAVGTVDRVLPWRRHHEAAAPVELTPLLASYRRRHPKAPVATINRAYQVAAEAHRSQLRSSGESYINHPLAVARIVADIGLDEISVAAALLHDAVEDTEITLADVEADFGDEVAAIVDGVTKLERIQFDSREAQQAATMRKMLVAMARDLRVLVIKLADRLHNMRTIAAMPLAKQQRIAQETLDIYAPLAHRLGMQEIKQQLEDLSFAALHPKRFAELDHLVSSRSPEREVYLAAAIAEVRSRLAELGIDAEVTGRGKHLWSLYEKMVVKGREFDDIFDLVAVRVIVDSMKDCYAALGCIHGRWRPVVGRFKDYIAMPKFNLYQSLHTTVIGPNGKAIEVQIRTREMHQRAEWGVAAHWAYKDDSPSNDIDWLNRIIDWQAEVSDPAQFMQSLKTDLEQDEVFVFTPKGRVVTLPVGSTTVDFAYAVHTEVGHACIGAKVNGRLVSLDHTLASGDTCEIFTSKVETAGPSQDWLRLRQVAAGAQQDPPVVQPRAPPRHDRAGPRRAGRGAAPRGPAGAADVGVGPAQGGHRRVQLRRPRRPAGGDRRAPRLGPRRRPACRPGLPRRRRRGAAAGDRAAAAPPPHAVGQGRRPRRGPRRRARAPGPVLHAGARRRDHRLRHPRPRASACTAPTAPTR